MLSVFPDVLFLAPVGAFLLRVTAGFIFVYLAYFYFTQRGKLGQIRFPIVGAGVWIPVLVGIWTALTGAGLLLGLYAQIAALMGALTALKFLVWKRSWGDMFPLERTTSILLLVVCISVFLTGAGPFGFDLPL